MFKESNGGNSRSASTGAVPPNKPIIAVVQASNIHGDVRPTPAQIAAQVWMAIVHGAAGIEYYCHQIDPAVNETDCLDAADGPATLTRIQVGPDQMVTGAPIR